MREPSVSDEGTPTRIPATQGGGGGSGDDAFAFGGGRGASATPDRGGSGASPAAIAAAAAAAAARNRTPMPPGVLATSTPSPMVNRRQPRTADFLDGGNGFAMPTSHQRRGGTSHTGSRGVAPGSAAAAAAAARGGRSSEHNPSNATTDESTLLLGDLSSHFAAAGSGSGSSGSSTGSATGRGGGGGGGGGGAGRSFGSNALLGPARWREWVANDDVLPRLFAEGALWDLLAALTSMASTAGSGPAGSDAAAGDHRPNPDAAHGASVFGHRSGGVGGVGGHQSLVATSPEKAVPGAADTGTVSRRWATNPALMGADLHVAIQNLASDTAGAHAALFELLARFLRAPRLAHVRVPILRIVRTLVGTSLLARAAYCERAEGPPAGSGEADEPGSGRRAAEGCMGYLSGDPLPPLPASDGWIPAPVGRGGATGPSTRWRVWGDESSPSVNARMTQLLRVGVDGLAAGESPPAGASSVSSAAVAATVGGTAAATAGSATKSPRGAAGGASGVYGDGSILAVAVDAIAGADEDDADLLVEVLSLAELTVEVASNAASPRLAADVERLLTIPKFSYYLKHEDVRVCQAVLRFASAALRLRPVFDCLADGAASGNFLAVAASLLGCELPAYDAADVVQLRWLALRCDSFCCCWCCCCCCCVAPVVSHERYFGSVVQHSLWGGGAALVPLPR